MNSIIIFWAICSFFIIIQFHCKNKRFLFYLQKSFGYLWDLWVIYEHLCSNLQFISLPEEVGEFLLYIMLKENTNRCWKTSVSLVILQLRKFILIEGKWFFYKILSAGQKADIKDKCTADKRKSLSAGFHEIYKIIFDQNHKTIRKILFFFFWFLL